MHVVTVVVKLNKHLTNSIHGSGGIIMYGAELMLKMFASVCDFTLKYILQDNDLKQWLSILVIKYLCSSCFGCLSVDTHPFPMIA